MSEASCAGGEPRRAERLSFSVLSDLNWLAVVVLGALWYVPKPMADAWTKSMGWDRPRRTSSGRRDLPRSSGDLTAVSVSRCHGIG